MEFNKIEPGRELDALIAEKVMGWRRVEDGEPYFWPTQEMIDTILKKHPDTLAVDYFPAPDFSTYDTMATLVIAKVLETTGRRIELVGIRDDWVCHFSELHGLEFQVIGHSQSECSTLAHAVCEAALDIALNAPEVNDE